MGGAFTLLEQKTGRKSKSQTHLKQHARRSKERERKEIIRLQNSRKLSVNSSKKKRKRDEAAASGLSVVFSARFERVLLSSAPATYI